MTPWCSFIICVLLNCSEAQGTKTSQGQDHEHRPFIVWQFGPKRHFLQHVPDISVLETGAHLHEVPVAMNAKGAGYWLFSFDPFGEGVMEWCALKEGGDVVVQFKIKWTNDSRNFYDSTRLHYASVSQGQSVKRLSPTIEQREAFQEFSRCHKMPKGAKCSRSV